MIKLMVEKQGKYFIITIDGKKILYWDKLQGAVWGGPLQYLPQDSGIQKKIQMSRNRIPAEFVNLFFIPKWELDEFEKAQTEEELRDIVVRDLKKHNCKVVEETNEIKKEQQ